MTPTATMLATIGSMCSTPSTSAMAARALPPIDVTAVPALNSRS
jgi:hypothetical protein